MKKTTPKVRALKQGQGSRKSANHGIPRVQLIPHYIPRSAGFAKSDNLIYLTPRSFEKQYIQKSVWVWRSLCAYLPTLYYTNCSTTLARFLLHPLLKSWGTTSQIKGSRPPGQSQSEFLFFISL